MRNNHIKYILVVTMAILLSCNLKAIADEETMVFAIDLIRHGDRAPIADIPSAPYKWPQGIGQLTAEGMNQEFQLGKEFRQRYIEKTHLLPETYNCESMYVRASDVDRTLMSAECTLLGLYPFGQGPRTDAGIDGLPSRFQPIPIHTRPRDTDNVLVPDANKALAEARAKYVYESDEWKSRLAKEQPNFERWSRLTGIKIAGLQQMITIGDTFHIRQIHHVPLPAGVTQEDADAMANLGEWVYAQSFKPAPVGQAGGLNLLKLIVKYLDDASKDDSKLKYVLLSAHDSTISALLSAMRTPADVRPHYSSDLNVTLWRVGQAYRVKVSLNGDPVNFPGAENGASSLDKFDELAGAASASASAPAPPAAVDPAK